MPLLLIDVLITDTYSEQPTVNPPIYQLHFYFWKMFI